MMSVIHRLVGRLFQRAGSAESGTGGRQEEADVSTGAARGLLPV